jgi:GT2 family glycosyltransferase
MSAPATLVSVIVPTRDRPDALARCLALLAPGVQVLDASRYEVVVTDDGSSDVARDLIASRFAWARHVTGPRRGPAANRNAGSRAGHGDWVAFTDDDTLPDRDWLETLVAMSEGVDVVEGRTTCRDGVRSPREHAPVNDSGSRWWSCNLAVRRSAFDRLGGFDERFRIPHMEDVDLRERALAAKIPWRFAPGAVVDHPPRRERWGVAWDAVHQAEVLFAVIHSRRFPLWRCLLEVTRTRWRAIARAPFSTDAVSAAVSWAIESVSVVVRWRGWWRTARAWAA